MARQRQDPIALLESAALNRDIAICGIIRCEVGRGVRSAQALARLQAFWDAMIYVPTNNVIWEEAEKMLWKMDRQGTQIPLPDAVIACCALRISAAVLTFDGHFKLIEGLKVISDPSLL